MSYKKGQSGNLAGRPKRALHKISAEEREYFRDYLRANKNKFEKELKSMKGKNYVQTYLALMQYILPKPAATELKEVPKLEEFIAMTPEERQVVIEEIRESLNQ